MLRGERPDPQVLRRGSCPGTRRRGGSASDPGTCARTSGACSNSRTASSSRSSKSSAFGLAQAGLIARASRAISARGGSTAFSARNVGSSISFFARLIGAEDGARPELAGERQVLLAQDLLHQRCLVVGVVDDEPPTDADRLAVAAQHAGAQRVERAACDVPAALADEPDDPLAQLGRGPVREGDREDPPRRDALDADEVCDPVGQDPGLARPAPARIRSGPSVVVTARACSGLRARMICAARSRAAFLECGWVDGRAGAQGPRLWTAGTRSQSGSSGVAEGSSRSAKAVPTASAAAAMASSSQGSPDRRRREGLTCPL